MMGYTEKMTELKQASMTQTPMPRYQCHKKVWALKIKTIDIIRPTIEELQRMLESEDRSLDPVSAIITPEDKGYGVFGVTQSYLRKHDPQVGGYYVVYEDGYLSYSPAKAFEEGYTSI